MARIVKLTGTGPIKIDPKTWPPDKLIAVCGCGLSQNLPFCDGSHKACRDELPGKVYVYDDERRSISEVRDA